MKLYEIGTTVVIVVLVVTAIGLSSKYFMEDDNVIEETCEQIIEIGTGHKVDLSEGSPEDPSKLVYKKRVRKKIPAPRQSTRVVSSVNTDCSGSDS